CDTEAEAPVVTPTEGCQRLRAIRIWEIDTEPQKVVTPTEGRQRLKKLTSLMLQAQHILEHAPVAVVAIIVGLVTLFVHGYRLNVAPDIFSDEGIYLLVGANLARGAGLTLNHSVFQWHPPVYMLVEAAYI